MGFDFGKEITEGVQAFKDREMLKTAATYLAVQLGTIVAFIVIAAVFVILILGGKIALDGVSQEQFAGAEMPVLIGILVFLFGMMVTLVLVRTFFEMRFTVRALALSGYKGTKKMELMEYIMMGVRWWLVTFFTWYEKRILYAWLGGYVAAVVLFIIGIASGGIAGYLVMVGAILILCVAFLAHIIGIFYHGIRLGLVPLYFFQYGMKESEPLKASWKTMEGNLRECFAIVLVLAIVGLLVAVPMIMAGWLIGLVWAPADTLVNLLVAPFLLILTFKFEAQVYRYFDPAGKKVRLVEVKKAKKE